MGISENDLMWEVQERLENRLYDEGYSECEVVFQSRPSEFLPPQSSKKKFADLSFIADLIVTKRVDWVPSELDSIENLERWFPTDSVEVPVAIIELKREVGFEDIHDSNFKFKNLRLWNTSQNYGGILGLLVNFDSTDNLELDSGEDSSISDSSRIEVGHSLRRGDFILQVTSNIDNDWLSDSIISPIIEHIESVNDEDLVESFSLEDTVDAFEPDVFHFNEVLNAYRNGRNKILIVLLSVFFESYVNELVDDHVSELKENEQAKDIYKDWDFYSTLNACRFFGILEEQEYELINKIRSARNAYAHEFEDYHAQQESQLEQEGRTEEAIQLYESLIGVKDSMVD